VKTVPPLLIASVPLSPLLVPNNDKAEGVPAEPSEPPFNSSEPLLTVVPPV